MSSEPEKLDSPNFKVFLKELFRIGATAFGGPLVNLNMMKSAFVDKHRWLSTNEFFQRMGISKVLPGPLSTLVALSVARELFGPWRALFALLVFVSPAFVIVCLWFYLEPQIRNFVNPAFADSFIWSVQVFIFFAITEAALKLLRDFWKNLPYKFTTKLFYSVFIGALSLAGVWMGLGELEVVLLIVILSLALRGSLTKMDRLSAFDQSIYLLFLKASLVVFGTGYMLFPYIERTLVDTGFLSHGEFAKGLLLGNLSPGPVVIATTYYGLALKGFAGGVLATLGVFSGPVLLMLLLFPVLEKVREKPWMQHLSISISPAVVVILLNFNRSFLKLLDFSLIGFIAVVAYLANIIMGSKFSRSLIIATVLALLHWLSVK